MDRCFDVPAHLLAAGALAPDSCGVPAEPLTEAVARTSELWLPEGHHWDLHIEHDHRVQTGPFAAGRYAMCWHITVSPWDTVDSMRQVLHDKAAEPHFVIGARAGTEHPVVIQLLPLDQFGKALMHPSGTPETNRAKKIQVEICANEQTIRSFTHYRALANLFVLVQHRVPIRSVVSRSFSSSQRFTASGYPNVSGMHGHMHVPNNSHVDPTTAFEGGKLQRLIDGIPDGGYGL